MKRTNNVEPAKEKKIKEELELRGQSTYTEEDKAIQDKRLEEQKQKEAKFQAAFKKQAYNSAISEIRDILEQLGIEGDEGEVIGTNYGKALTFLRAQHHGSARETCDRMSLRLRVDPRRVREVYFKPFLREGIIKNVGFTEKDLQWEWIGKTGIKPVRNPE
jgi:hypothetical protein